ncbi:MAG: hypothetical protein Q8910_02795 [Bacteroidota bacterium]|nr:hypothetical protein [Bacteroidota bacterium]
MFSKTSGEAIAVIKGEDRPNKILYITDDRDDELDIDYDNIDDDFYKAVTKSKTKNKMMSPIEITKLKYYLSKNVQPFDEDDRNIYDLKRSEITDRNKYEINLPHGEHFELMPPIQESQRIAIAGMTGSGKSYQTAAYIQKYHHIHKKNKIFMFSMHETDPAYDDLDYIVRIDISEENILNTKLDIVFLHDSLCIFDDTDNIQNKKVSDAIDKLISDILANGRHHDISAIICLHQICNYKKTKPILADISGTLLFLNGSKYNVCRYLKCYAGLDQKQIKKITSLKSRWFYISLVQPMYVLSEYKAFIIKD